MPISGRERLQRQFANEIKSHNNTRDQRDKLQAALVDLKCHLYAQEAMTDGEIIAACRVIADRALAKEEGK